MTDGGPADPAAELVEVVDEHGAVVDVVTRARMRAENLIHRCTYVAVVVGAVDALGLSPGRGALTPDTMLVVHQRAAWKDTCPSYWDIAFGGVCGVGEAWHTSAARELAEEAGIEGAVLADLGPSYYEDETTRTHGRVFVTAWPDEPTTPDGEVVAVDRVSMAELDSWLGSVPVCPDTAAIVPPLLRGLLVEF